MDQTLQMYIDKLNKLNFREMYEGDFFLTWEKSREELEAVFTVADALRLYARAQHLHQGVSTPVWASPCPDNPPAPVSPLPAPATCWVWRSRTSTRARARWPTARPCARPPT
jgi:hypothetical protein